MTSTLYAPLPQRGRLTRKRTTRRLLSTVVIAAMTATLLHVPAQAAPAAKVGAPPRRPTPTVPVKEVKPGPPAATKPIPKADTKPAPVWPRAGETVVNLTASARHGSPARAGSLPVTVGKPEPTATALWAAETPRRIRVELLDRAATTRAGVEGLLLRVGRADGAARGAAARVNVDYRQFASAHGADWSSRLRMVSLPDCALSTPASKKCAGTPLPSRNDPATRTVSATVPMSSTAGLVALEAAPAGPAGDYTATSLRPSATWAAGGSTGAFTWSYPMRVAPSLGGPAPQLALSYSSQSVDGQHAASNNQPSWVGEGFEQSMGGFIERRYKSCSKDMNGSANNDKKTGDLCWETDNAVLSLPGHTGELIYNSAEGRWHLRSDDGSRIERRTGAANGDNNGEHWVLTTTDGTQYWFGVNRLPGWASGNPVTDSTWTAPVFGNDPGEPCHAAAFIDSDCVQAWRWNLDYVVDLSGNSVSYWYEKETNKYGRNFDPNDDAAYNRGGWLDRIDYGTRRINGVDSALNTLAPLRVDLAVADRCLSGCATHDEVHWPDTPWDMLCSGTTCTGNVYPTFWSTKRLSTVTTQVRDGTGYDNVERWTFTHSFPDPGDGTRAGMWLDKISHVGLAGTTVAVPDVEFTPVQLSNRVDTEDFAAAMNWMRIAKIRNETGGTVNVTYSEQDCKAGQPMPAPHTNTRRCYPVIWEPEGYSTLVTDWFHKYVVTTIYEIDHTGGTPPQGSPRVVYSYSYLDGAAWHYRDDDGLVDKAEKTWSEFRGYGRVGVTVGDPGEQTYTESRYFRGMHGDRAAPAGGTRDVTIDGIADEDWYAGLTRETRVFNGPSGPVVAHEFNVPWSSPATATRTMNGDTVTARFSRVATATRHTALDGGRPDRITKVTTTYDHYGMAIAVDDFGQDGVSGDEQCTKTDYTPRNPTAWLMDRVHRVQTYAVGCAQTGGALTEDDVIGETRTRYDDHAFQAEPSRGLATHTDEMAAWNAGVPTFTTIKREAYDVHGRVTSSWDAMDKLTTMAYTPASDGSVTSTLVKNPLQHATNTVLHPAWGLPKSITDPNGKTTELGYDALGRLTSVRMPGRDKATNTFSYQMRAEAPSVVASSRLNAAGEYVTSYELFDGLLRSRQTQNPSASGGRLLTDSFYDSAGRLSKAYGAYHATGAPGGTLVTATERVHVPNQTRTVYDGAGRSTASIFQPYDVERWRTSTYYSGDRTDTTPPQGGTATSKVIDARDRTLEMRQYHGATPTPGTPGSWDTTSYTYDRKGHLSKVTDAAGNSWIYRYDLRGRQTQLDDPDKGLSTSTYDNAGRVVTSTDARGKKLAHLYDPLGRKRATYEDKIGGPLRAQWVYDTIAKGQLSQSTRMVGSAAYQSKILDYTDSYKPGGTQVVIPDTETGLAGTYNFNNTYNVDDSLATTSLPSTNSGLSAETLSYGYNSLGLPSTLGTLYGDVQSSYVADTDYNALGQVEQLELYTGTDGRVWQVFTRELETGRLTGIRTDRDSVAPHTVADVRYTFDQAGNITKATDVAPEPADDTQCYNYDHLRRLTEAWTPTSGDCAANPSATELGGPAPYWHTWTFDKIGNRRSGVAHTAAGTSTTTYEYPTPGSRQPHALTATSGAQSGAYQYDATGNTISRPTPNAGTQALTWDPEGRLETSTDAGGETRYIYDADGSRLIRRDPAGKTLYLPGQEIRYTTSTGANSCVRYYALGGSVVASRTAAGVTWLSADHQGTAQVGIQAGSQQAVVRRQTPYGAPRGTVPIWPNDKGFVGGTTDNTGLTHLGAREYDPVTGRFISLDPIMDLLDPQQINGYAYSNNNPTTFSDPTGLKFEEETVAEYGRRMAKHREKQRQSWLSRQVNLRHDAAKEAAQRRIKKQVADMGGDPEMVILEYEIPGACKSHKSCKNPGRADIVYIDEKTNTIYVWEVTSAANPIKGAAKAARDVALYMRKLSDTGRFDQVEAGFALTSLVFAGVPGSREAVVASNGPTKGSILYRTFRFREPKPPPPPQTAPEPVRVPVEVPKPAVDPVLVGVGIGIGVGIVAGVCIVATAGVCGVAIGAGVVGGAAAASG